MTGEKAQTASTSSQELEQLLASVEQRAYQMARFALHDESEALDLVQEAMLRLVTRYADKPPEQWRPLFFRILQRLITDWHRRQAIKRKVFFWHKPSDDEQQDLQIEQLPGAPQDSLSAELGLHQQRLTALVPVLVEQLPLRQQQCFLLRCWEGLDVKQTAQAMGCSEGSVKTHYSRALASLRQSLEPEV